MIKIPIHKRYIWSKILIVNLKKHKSVGLKHYNDPKALIENSIDMHETTEEFNQITEEFNPGKIGKYECLTSE